MLWINIALIIFGLAAVLSAFGGDTLGESSLAFGGDRWSRGDLALYKRITFRGWLSLVCLFIAIGLGIAKDAIQYQTVLKETTSRTKLEKDNARLHKRVAEHVMEIVALQTQINKATKDLSEMTDHIQEEQLDSFEDAFKRAFKPPREIDDAIVVLDGRTKIPIPSRYREQMQLYWGDQFQLITIIEEPSESNLDSIQLEAGDKTYSLFDSPSPGPFKKTVHIDGNSPNPMPAAILNPLQLNNMTLKVFVRTAESSQGQDKFKRLILTSRFPALAKKLYKVTTPDILNVRSTPDATSQIRARLSRGSFVRSMQTQSDWTEVKTPAGKQGWVITRFLTEIE